MLNESRESDTILGETYTNANKQLLIAVKSNDDFETEYWADIRNLFKRDLRVNFEKTRAIVKMIDGIDTIWK